MKKGPPIALVKTWVHLIRSSESREVKDRATVTLLNAFGDVKSAIAFCRLHNIDFR